MMGLSAVAKQRLAAGGKMMADAKARKERSAAETAEIPALVAAAQQGDQAAIARLNDIGDVGTRGRGTATSRATKNKAREALRNLGYSGADYKTINKKTSFLQDVGGVVKKAAPLAALIPGVGPLAAAAIAAGGSALHGDNLGQIAGSGLYGYGGAKLVGGAKAMLSGAGAAGAAGGAGAGAAPAAGAPGAAAPAAGGGGGLLGRATDFVKSNPGLVTGAIGAINSAGQQAKGSNAVDEAGDIARARYNQTAPLRARAISMLSQPIPQARDLSYLNDAANPFARRAPAAAALAPVGPQSMSVR